MKTIKVTYETWKLLVQLKIDLNARSINDVIVLAVGKLMEADKK